MSFLSRIVGSRRRLAGSGAALAGLLALLAVYVTMRAGTKPIETAVEEPAGQAAEKAPAKPAEKPAGKVPEKPAAKTGEKPAEKTAGKTAGKPAEKTATGSDRSVGSDGLGKPAAKPPEKPVTKPPEKPAAKPPVRPAENPGEAPPKFEEAILQVRPPDKPLTVAELQALLEPLGTPYRLTPSGQNVKFQGLGRIRAWIGDSLLRLENFDTNHPRRIHFWGQKQGVTVCLYPQNNAVAAYRTLQDPRPGVPGAPRIPQPAVALGELLATDDGRNARFPGGTFHVSCQNGAVVFSRGDLQLLIAPLEEPVTAVYFEAPEDTELHDLALLRSGPAPADSPPLHRMVFDAARPADLPWKEDLPAGARLLRRDDGSVELSAAKVPRLASATLPVAGPGLYCVIFQVEDATPGSGIALLNAAGQPLDGIDYSRAPNSKIIFGPGSFDERRPIPYAGPGQWLRLVVAGGVSKSWISGDGIHWGIVFDPAARTGVWRDIGLCLRPNVDPQKPNDVPKPEDTPRRIRLCHLQIRELDGLTGSVSPELRGKAAATDVDFRPNETVDAWTERIDKLAPADAAAGEWRSACVIQVLAGPVNSDIATVVLDRAVAERLNKLPALQARIRLLQDAALIGRNRPEDAAQQAEHWEQLGRDVLQAGTEAQFQQYQKARLETACGGGLMSPTLAGQALLLFFADHRWGELDRFEKRLSYSIAAFGGSLVDGKLLDWMSQRTAGWVARKSVSPSDFLQPLVVPVSRAASGVFQNLQSALEDRQFQEAARLLTTSYALRDDGLIATPTDEQLLVSYRGMQRILLHRRKLAEAISGVLDDAARLKVQQALTQGDPAAVEALTVEYYGTTAHAEACRWLGDRALAGSDFSRALAWYEEGRLTAAAEQQPDLAARVRLAAAMLGYLRGEPPAQPVSFGEVQVSPEQFERRVRTALSKQRAKVEAASLADALPQLPSPAGRTRPDGRGAGGEGGSRPVLPSTSGRGAGGEGGSRPVQFQFAPWGQFDAGGNPPAGPLATAAGDDLLIVASRTRAAAIEPATGKTQWSWDLGNSRAPGPIYPLVAGQRVYFRSMTTPGKYGIVCLDRTNGRGLWRRDCGDEVAGDPQLFQGRLYVLTLGPPTGGGMSLQPMSLVEMDAESGEVLSRSHFAEVARPPNSSPDRPAECQSILVGNRLIATFCGAVLCLDLRGSVQWLRTSEAVPAEIDPTSAAQLCQMPRESGGRLYLQQPGKCAVECLKAETGELVWRRGVLGLQRIVDLNGDRLLVQSAQGLTALRTAKGEVLWRRELPGLLGAFARGAAGQIVCTRQVVLPDKSQLATLWIVAATGRTAAHSLLPLPYRDSLLLGPIVAGGDQAWCFGNRGIQADLRPAGNGIWIFALRPSGSALAGDVP